MIYSVAYAVSRSMSLSILLSLSQLEESYIFHKGLELSPYQNLKRVRQKVDYALKLHNTRNK